MNDWMARLWSVGDIVIVHGDAYKVTGVYLGALNCTSMIGLKPMTERPGHAGTETVEEMFVPLPILNAAIGERANHYKPII